MKVVTPQQLHRSYRNFLEKYIPSYLHHSVPELARLLQTQDAVQAQQYLDTLLNSPRKPPPDSNTHDQENPSITQSKKLKLAEQPILFDALSNNKNNPNRETLPDRKLNSIDRPFQKKKLDTADHKTNISHRTPNTSRCTTDSQKNAHQTSTDKVNIQYDSMRKQLVKDTIRSMSQIFILNKKKIDKYEDKCGEPNWN